MARTAGGCGYKGEVDFLKLRLCSRLRTAYTPSLRFYDAPHAYSYLTFHVGHKCVFAVLARKVARAGQALFKAWKVSLLNGKIHGAGFRASG